MRKKKGSGTIQHSKNTYQGSRNRPALGSCFPPEPADPQKSSFSGRGNLSVLVTDTATLVSTEMLVCDQLVQKDPITCNFSFMGVYICVWSQFKMARH